MAVNLSEASMPKLSTKSERYESVKRSIQTILGPDIEFELDMNTAYYIHGLDEPFKAIAILQEAYNVLLNQNKEPDRQKALLALIHQRAQEAEGYKQSKKHPVNYPELVDKGDWILDEKEVQIKEYKKKVQFIDEYKPLPKLDKLVKDNSDWQKSQANQISGKLSGAVTQVDKGALTASGIGMLAAQMSKNLAGTIDGLIANTEVKTELQNAIMQYSNYTNISDYELGVTKVTTNPLPVSPAPEPKRIVYVEEKVGRKFREE